MLKVINITYVLITWDSDMTCKLAVLGTVDDGEELNI